MSILNTNEQRRSTDMESRLHKLNTIYYAILKHNSSWYPQKYRMKLTLLSESLEAPLDNDEFGKPNYYARLYRGNALIAQADGEELEAPYNSANGIALEVLSEIYLAPLGRRIGDFMIEISKHDRQGCRLIVNVIARSISKLKERTLEEIQKNHPDDWNDEAIDDYKYLE